MFGSAILDVIIGILFIFILVSTICSAIREGIEAWLKSRAAYLEYGIRELLHDQDGKGLAGSFYNHPLIHSLYLRRYKPGNLAKRPGLLAKGNDLPSYIPSKNFAVALMDIAARGPKTDLISSNPQSPIISLDNIRLNIGNLENPEVQRVLLTALDSAQGDLNKMQANLEAWFDSSMDRVSGWYRRSTQWLILVISLGVCIALNVNTITIADFLIRNDAERTTLAAAAITASRDSGLVSSNYQQARDELNSLNMPIGWGHGWGAPKHEGEPGYGGMWNNLFAPILGWLITAIAATIGAPFWFDVLNKIMVVRSTVKPHEKSQEEDSEDRQLKGPTAVNQDYGQGQMPDRMERPQFAAAITNKELIASPSPRDETSDIDGCAGAIDEITKDSELPPAQGGVL